MILQQELAMLLKKIFDTVTNHKDLFSLPKKHNFSQNRNKSIFYS